MKAIIQRICLQLLRGSDVTAGFEEAFRRCLRLKQQAQNRFHNRGIIAYSDSP